LYLAIRGGIDRVVTSAPLTLWRKSFEINLDLDSVSGRAEGFNLESIRELKSIIEGLDKETKKILSSNARNHL
jgi:hypothetical protein